MLQRFHFIRINLIILKRYFNQGQIHWVSLKVKKDAHAMILFFLTIAANDFGAKKSVRCNQLALSDLVTRETQRNSPACVQYTK